MASTSSKPGPHGADDSALIQPVGPTTTQGKSASRQQAAASAPLDALQQLLGGNATRDYLDGKLKQSVVGAMRSCLERRPEHAITHIAKTLRGSNPNRKHQTVEFSIDGVGSELRRDRIEKAKLRQFRHPRLPLIADINPSRDDLYKHVNTVRDMQNKLRTQADAEVAIDPKDMAAAPHLKDNNPAGSPITPAVASPSDSTDLAGTAPPAPLTTTSSSSASLAATRVKLILVAPTDSEVVFVNGVPMVGNYVRSMAATVRSQSPLVADPTAEYPPPGAENDEEFSGIQRAESGPMTPRNDQLAAPQEVDESPGDDLDATRPPVHASESHQKSRHAGMTITQSEELVASVVSKQESTTAMSTRKMGEYISNAFSTSAITVDVLVLRTPDRYALAVDLFSRIDEFVGTSDAAPVLPTIVACVGVRSYVYRNVITAVASAMQPLAQIEEFQQNKRMLYKRQVELAARESRNEARLVNAAAYWAKVRARREQRDKVREQKANEILKRVPVPPIPGNIPEEDRIAQEEKRRKDEEARKLLESNFESASHAARVKRQARRSRADTKAVEVMHSQELSSSRIINTVLRGYLIRRKLRSRLAEVRARMAFDSPATDALAASIRSSRRRPGKRDELDYVNENFSYALERKIVHELVTCYQEITSLKPPTAKPAPRRYDNWTPQRKRIDAVFEGDVSSDDEDWTCDDYFGAPVLQTVRFRVFNPLVRLDQVLAETKNTLFTDIAALVNQFGNVSPLQRQAYAMLSTKLMHVMHTLFLEVAHRGELPPAVLSFAEFVKHHFPEYDTWFASPWQLAESISATGDPVSVEAGAVPALLGQKNHALVFDSGCFDVRAHHVFEAVEEEDPTADPTVSTKSVSRQQTSLEDRPPAERESPPPAADRSQSQASTVGNSRRETSASQVQTGSGSVVPAGDAATSSVFVRLHPTSSVYVVPDSVNMDTTRSHLANIVHNSQASCLLWLSTSPEPVVYVNKQPYFLARRFEHETIAGAAAFTDYTAMSQVVATNPAPTDAEANPKPSPGRERRMSMTRMTAPQGSSSGHSGMPTPQNPSLPPPTKDQPHRASAASTVGSRGSHSIDRGAAGSHNSKSPTTFTPSPVPRKAMTHLAHSFGVSILELEERLRAEILSAIDKAEGVYKFFAHRSVVSAEFLVVQQNGQCVVTDPYKQLLAAVTNSPGVAGSRTHSRTHSSGSSPLGFAGGSLPRVCSARSRDCDAVELQQTVVAVPKKEVPTRTSIATTRASMYHSTSAGAFENSFAFGNSTPTPRSMATGGGGASTPQRASNATASSRQAALKRKQSVASYRSEGAASGGHNDAASTGNESLSSSVAAQGKESGTMQPDARASIGLPPSDQMPELDQLASLVQSPQQLFDDVLTNHLPGDLPTRNFVRCPMHPTGPSDWLLRYSGLIKVAFEHLAAAATDGGTKTAVVVACNSPESMLYAATVEIISALVFERFDALYEAPTESAKAQQDPGLDAVFASVRIAGGGGANASGSSLTPPVVQKMSKRGGKIETHDRVFGGLLALDVFDPQLNIRSAMKAVDVILRRAGLLESVKNRIASLRQLAENARGTMQCRTHVRECCQALERFTFLVYLTSLLLQTVKDAAPTVVPDCPDLYDAVMRTVGGESIERFVESIDPWATTPHLSPDPFHVELYSGGAARWRELVFVERVV